MRPATLELTTLGRGCLSALLLGSLFGCAKSDPIPRVDDLPGSGCEAQGALCGAGGNDLLPTQCNLDETQCGRGCCPADNVCSERKNCVPSNACETNNDCIGDSVCGPSDICTVRGDGADDQVSPECRNNVQLAGVIPKVQCQWPGLSTPRELPDSTQVMGTPMVVDFNLDKDDSTSHPSIVFISHEGIFSRRENTALRIVDGEDCTLQFTVAGRSRTRDDSSTANPYFLTEIAPALGDIDGDGLPDIVAATSGVNGAESVRDGLIAFSLASGSPEQLWISPQSNTGDIGGIAIHDLDDDGVPEILTARSIFDASGDDIFSLATGSREAPLVMNITASPAVELITNQGIFNWNPTLQKTEAVEIIENGDLTDLWSDNEKGPNMFVAAANLVDLGTQLNGGGSDSVEMIMVGLDGSIVVSKADGTSIHRVSGNQQGQAGGPVIIADFDGDGRMEFASAGRTMLTVYDLDCKVGVTYENGECAVEKNVDAVLWNVPVQSEQTAASVFDFDGDGRAEVVYADQCFMRIYDGRSGRVLFSVPRSSLTKYEYPVVADVDGDSFSELIIGSNDANTVVTASCAGADPQFPSVSYEPTRGLTVWSDPADLWAGSRPIWNQHTYNVNNVLDDGTVPASSKVKNSWNPVVGGGPNTFRQNVQGETGASVDKPDLTISASAEYTCRINSGNVILGFDLCNRGLVDLPAGAASATMTRSTDGGPATPLGETVEAGALAQGECELMSVTAPYISGEGGFDVMVRADLSNRVDECAEQNNAAMISNVFCPDIR